MFIFHILYHILFDIILYRLLHLLNRLAKKLENFPYYVHISTSLGYYIIYIYIYIYYIKDYQTLLARVVTNC